MVASQATDFNGKSLTPALFKHILLWIPIVGGIIHQFVMGVFDYDCMPVLLDPPGYLKPTVTLEYQWWLLLILVSAFVFVLAYLERIRTFPNRLVVPFYFYILFLLIFVKPVSGHGGEAPARCGPDAEATPTPSAIIWDDSFPSECLPLTNVLSRQA
jgi:hypothetical protein